MFGECPCPFYTLFLTLPPFVCSLVFYFLEYLRRNRQNDFKDTASGMRSVTPVEASFFQSATGPWKDPGFFQNSMPE